MQAAILAIGDELVLGENVDTNSAWLSTQLAQHGVLTIEHRTVGDDRQRIAATIVELAQQVNVLIMTGGLGPTQDDLSRHALNDAMDPGKELLVDEEAVRLLKVIFSKHGRPMPE
ncbi:MAG: molybdopterin-binding protein, partial [Planctomycetota bacterium]|nr:molybdopterin-binding protein [Planctomycetota bacterium]